MKTPSKKVLLFFLALTLVFAGCTSPVAPSPVTSVSTPSATRSLADDPLARVVLNMVERINAGDLDGSLSYFAEDSITYFVGLPPTGMEIYRGKGELRPIWEDCINNHFKMEVEILSVHGDIVNARSKTWHDFTRQLEVAPNEFVEIYQVKDNRIVVYTSTITGQSLAKFMPALAQVMPSEPAIIPTSADPVSEITVTFADGTCSYTGPLALKSGEIQVKMIATDTGEKTYGLTFFTLDTGKTFLDLMAATYLATPPAWSRMVTLWEFTSGESKTVTFSTQSGPLYLVCWSKPPVIVIGNAGPFEVR